MNACSDTVVEETVPAVLLLQDEHERDLIDSVILEHVFVTLRNDLLGLVHANDFQCVVEVGDGDLLDLQHVVGVEDRLEVLRGQERL